MMYEMMFGKVPWIGSGTDLRKGKKKKKNREKEKERKQKGLNSSTFFFNRLFGWF